MADYKPNKFKTLNSKKQTKMKPQKMSASKQADMMMKQANMMMKKADMMMKRSEMMT